ncbi:MAG: bifunctional folylpolyglutamate synthase/dihydrofolate synthase, partial [Magnetovibrio sp.]|nr:bifunctional folylpolyglutamate synthase/dihydrofolate synthase [Magnetovibrio sp.]
ERILLDSRPVDDRTLIEAFARCEAANFGEPITFFEITTAAAFLAFSRHDADLVILETGLGGRLDATNVIDAPRLTCITPVSLDHQHFLGDTIEEIAAEKAGIFKPGVPCVIAAQSTKAAQKVLRKHGKDIGAPQIWEGKEWFSRSAGGRRSQADSGMLYAGHGEQGDVERKFPSPALEGRHQMRNAALAMACAEALAPDFKISDAAIELGLKTVSWPGRMQRLSGGPLSDLMPQGWELWLDGGHNRAAAEMLAQHTRGWRGEDLWLVFGALNQRPALDFLKPLEGKVRGVRCITIPDQKNALSADEGTQVANQLNMNAHPTETMAQPISSIIQEAPDGTRARILICGSLYLAGHVLQDNA